MTILNTGLVVRTLAYVWGHTAAGVSGLKSVADFADATATTAALATKANTATTYTKTEVDTGLAAKVDKAGGTMNADPTVALGVATKQFAEGMLRGRARNRNGDMRVVQRGTNFATPASGQYTLDGWQVQWSGAAPATVTRVAGPSGFQYAMQVTGAVGSTALNVNTKIESLNVADLVGKPGVFQVNLAASVGQTIGWACYSASAVDNFSTLNLVAAGSFTVTTTAQTFIGQLGNLPAGAANGLQFFFNPPAGFTSGHFSLTGFQFEAGTIATPFEFKPYSQVLAENRRYLPAFTSSSTVDFIGIGTVASATVGTAQFVFDVEPRIAPTGLTISSGNHFVTNLVVGTGTNCNPAFSSASRKLARMTTTISGATAGQVCELYASVAGAQLIFTGAEL